MKRPAFRLHLWLPPLALLVVAVLFFWQLAFTNLILARGDTFLYFYPYWDYRAQALLAGRLPLWNPLLFMGAPFLANSQAGVLYPLNWPLAVFAAPVAVKIAIVFHIGLAALGTYAFARRALGQSALGAGLAGVLFALGGYVTAQVEHVNQLQGLAWLPWVLLLTHQLGTPIPPREQLRVTLRLAAIFALQLLAGHTQTLFISGVGAGTYALVLSVARFRLVQTKDERRKTNDVRKLPITNYQSLFLPLALLVAALLAAAQLLPTLELSGQSLRGGGLSWQEAVSFSLDPRLLGRALLPGYSRALFSEFVAYSGVAGLVLALLGWRRSPAGWALLALCGVGLGFALGAYNPLYAGLAFLPPFNLFRVPARWLLLLALGVAVLAGWGVEAAWAGLKVRSRRSLVLLLPAILMALSLLSGGVVAAGETGPLGPPAASDWLGWLAALGLIGGVLWAPMPGRVRVAGLAALAVVELFVAARRLPYNSLTAPEAYSSVRPAMTQLLLEVCRSGWATPEHCPGSEPTQVVPGRFLSLSGLRFDPGDLAELRGALLPQLPQAAVDDYIVATKHKEVLSPNLPLAWNIAAVDGYDGGVLPLAHYAAFTQLFTGAASSDGRLRENLTAAPEARLLALVGGRYLITDKVGDAWIDGVFYDLQFSVTLGAGETMAVAYVPPFEATALGLVAEGAGTVRLTFDDGTQVTAPAAARVTFDTPATPATIELQGPLTVRGLSLIDERMGAFQTLALGPYRLAHSGDVKIYENLAVLPRAFVVGEALVIGDDAAARAALADATFDPARTVTLAEAPAEPPPAGAGGPATITAYTPERVRVTAEGPGYLLLTEAYYPGWVARVDGEAVPILRADVMFRAVALGPGTHEVVFSYEPVSVKLGLIVSGVAWVCLVGVGVWLGRSRQ